jgi:hypothetical protein
MMLDANNPTVEDDDLNTTAPNPEPEVWKMPEPVFQCTSGKLPQGYEKEVMAFSSAEASVPPSSSAPVPAAPEPVIKPKSSALKLMLVLLGIGAMVAFLVVFLTVVYFLFLR